MSSSAIPEVVSAFSAEVESVLKNVSAKISNFKGKRDKWARTASAFKIGAVVLGGLASIALGWKLPDGSGAISLTNVALILTVLVTAIGAIDAYFDPKSIWVLYSVAVRRLELLDVRLADLKEAAGDSAERVIAAKQDLAACKRDFEQVLNEVVTGWQSVRLERQ
jgi:hypothetical protein